MAKKNQSKRVDIGTFSREQQEMNNRSVACLNDIQKILKKHNCKMNINLDIVANPLGK